MDAAPIWTDLKSFPWAEFRGRVDILTGGYPCQPFSAAGKRLGTDDPRHLWPFIADGIRILRPRLCFFENVEGHISLGLREVIGELEQIGYQASWGIFSASEVGAVHQRKRVFILAYDQSQRIQGHWADRLQESRPHAGQGLPLRGGDAGCGELADALCNGGREGWLIRQGSDGSESVGNGKSWGAWPSRPGEPQHGWEPPRVVGHATHQRDINETEQNHSEAGTDTDRASKGASAMGHTNSPRPQERKGQRGAGIQGIDSHGGEDADRQIEPALGGDTDGPAGGLDYAVLQVSCDNRTDELRLLGNGVVPATAERAFRILIQEFI